MLVAIFFLLLVLIFTSVAEMGLSRITKPKAASLADQGLKPRQGAGAAGQRTRALGQPAAAHRQHLPDRAGRRSPASWPTGCSAPYGVIVGVVLNVLVFFVFAEAVPKTYAVLYPQQAALVTRRPVGGAGRRSRRCG